MNEVLTVLVIEEGVFLKLSESNGRIIGVSRVVRVRSIDVVRTSDRSITFTWICTKMDGS